MKAGYILVVLVSYFSACRSQSSFRTKIDNVRLTGAGNQYSGRLELLYNGTWGTVCDSSWGTTDANVACRMLGFDGASCAVYNANYGRASFSVPIWMSRVGCRGSERYLDQCTFNGWGPNFHRCYSHSDDAGVVCRNESLFSMPSLSVVRTTTRTITVTWPRAATTMNIYRQRYRIQYNTTGSSPRYTYSYSSLSASGPFTVTISNLIKGRSYSIAIRLEVAPRGCSRYSYSAYSSYSSALKVATNTTVPPSNFDVRLVPPVRGLNFTGRVEVNYRNNGWGTVCDYSFDLSDANVICNMLDYDGAVCAIYNGQLGRGSGKIWLNRLVCSSADILDQCSYRFWSLTSSSSRIGCRSTHYDDAGVVCRPRDPEDFLPAPQNFTSGNGGSTSITFTWKRFSFPSFLNYYFYYSRRFRISYTRSDRRGTYSINPSYLSTAYTLRRLPLGITVNATITAQGNFRRYGCSAFLDGGKSEMVSVTTEERPPSSAPLNFHVVVVNCSAIIAEWDFPSINTRNGIIRGFKLMYKSASGPEATVNLNANETEYVIGGLDPSTGYIVSVLAYTIGDGPRSIHLTATTNDMTICQTDVIDFFGINGNDLDRVTLYTFSRSVNVFCGSNSPNVQIDWYFSNGTKVGISNRRTREGHYSNGTTVLQIAYGSRATVCDADVYTCRANKTSKNDNRVQQRTFKVIYNRVPPTPGRPVILNVKSNNAVISWPKYECDGGHNLQYFNIRIGYSRSFSYRLTYRYIYNIDARFSNYTITGFIPSSTYFFSIQAVGKDSRRSSYSSQVSIVTLPPVPMPPQAVSTRLIRPDTISVTWSRPAVINGRIVWYTVYATPFNSRTSLTPRTKRQATSLQIVSRNFSSTATSGEVTLPQLGVEYHVQVSVTVFDTTSGRNRESLFSALSPTSTLFVPVRGLPVPSDVTASGSSNNSLTVSWTAPTSSGDIITGYLVEYSGNVDGRSPAGSLISYMQEGNATISSDLTRYTIQPLVPQTSYLIKVSALSSRGEGMQVTTTGTTTRAESEYERYVYFHVRFGPVPSCASFRKDLDGQEGVIRKQIFGYLKRSCNCGFTDDNIETGFFICGQQDHQIIYRAHILGTGSYSAIALVKLLQNWIQSGTASITVSNFRMQLDSTCPTRLDTLDDPECPVVEPSSTAVKPTDNEAKTESITRKPTQKPQQDVTTEEHQAGNPQQNVQPQIHSSGISATALGGMFVGLIVALLLVILIVLIIVVAFWKLNKSNVQKKNGRSKINTNRDSVMRFADLDNSGDGFGEEKLSDNLD